MKNDGTGVDLNTDFKECLLESPRLQIKQIY